MKIGCQHSNLTQGRESHQISNLLHSSGIPAQVLGAEMKCLTNPCMKWGICVSESHSLVTSVHCQILMNTTKQLFDANPKIPIYRTARATNNCVVKMCGHTRRGATARCLASWHAGCHSCYEKPGQRWVGRTICSNCARELYRRSRWAGSGGREPLLSVPHYSKI